MATVRRNISISEEQDAILRKYKVSLSKLVQEKIDEMVDYLTFARETEEAWQSYERGEFIKMDEKEFLEELKKW